MSTPELLLAIKAEHQQCSLGWAEMVLTARDQRDEWMLRYQARTDETYELIAEREKIREEQRRLEGQLRYMKRSYEGLKAAGERHEAVLKTLCEMVLPPRRPFGCGESVP